jgi:hypothetical protein
MKSLRLRILGSIIAVAVFASSCGESSPTAPVASITASDSTQGELLGVVTDLTRSLGLLSCRPLAAAWGSEWVGPAGGTVEVGAHSLRIPPGALDRWTRITGYAPRDDVRRIEFWPHGLEFDRPAQLTMSYANCSLVSRLVPKKIAYIDDDENILYTLLSIDNVLSSKVTGRVEHFSEYAVAY